MDTIQTQCPMCHSMFNVGRQFVNRRAKCKKCGREFRIKSPNLDDTIMGWLNDKAAAPKPDAEIAAALGGATPSSPTKPAAAIRTAQATTVKQAAAAPKAAAAARKIIQRQKVAVGPGDSAIADVDMEEMLEAPNPEDCLKFSHIDELGAFVLFPTMLLYNEQFRASMPRCCLGCGTTQNLSIHTVYWQSVRNDRKQETRDSEPVKSAVKADQYLELGDSELLAALPKVPNKPKPFNLPMPYYICNRCSPVGAIMTHVRQTASGREVCEIGINSIARAAQFIARNLGRQHEAFKALEDELIGGQDDPWRALPLSVRNRIDRWFKCEKNEQFMAYLLDHDFARAEAGLGGVVITNKRIVFHKFAAHREFEFDTPLQMQVVDKNGLYQLHLSNDNTKKAVLHCDSIVVDKIKQYLVTMEVKFKLDQ